MASMTSFAQIFGWAAATYALTCALGFGLTRLLLPGRRDLWIFYMPWVGIAQTDLLLILFGMLDIGTKQSYWVALGLSAVLLAMSQKRFRSSTENSAVKTPPWAVALGVLAITVVLMVPVLSKSAKMTSFTIGNNDLFDYTATAQYLQGTGLKKYLRDFGQQPEWEDATGIDRVVSWQIPAPRWLSYYYLAFLGSLYHKDTADLFSLYLSLLLAAAIPVIWLVGLQTLGLSGKWLWLGFGLALVNPHILYVLFHTFLPQICATGFFICFLSLFPDYVNEKDSGWGKTALLGLFASATLGSYLELYTFLFFIGTVYPGWLAVVRRISWRQALEKWGGVFGMVILLCPYQSYRMFSIVFWHAGMHGGGWDITNRYYLFLFQLGGFWSHAHQMKPSVLMERLLAPLLFFLIARGMLHEKHRHFSWIVLFPFLLSGYISFKHDWNYRYYKGFTYFYFYVPLLVACGAQSMSGWLRERKPFWKPVLAGLSGLLLLVTGATAAVKTFQSLKLSADTPFLVPLELKALKTADADPSFKRVYFQNLPSWDAMWAAYYLSQKNPVISYPVIYLRNDLSTLRESKTRHLLTRADAGGVLDPLEGFEVKRELVRAGPYALYELTGTQNPDALGINLGEGFYSLENNGNDQWVWMLSHGNIEVVSPRDQASVPLLLEFHSRQAQNLFVEINGREKGPFPLSGQGVESCRLDVALRKGNNRILIRTDKTPPPVPGNDPRPLNLQFTKIRIGSALH
jgi:hypothetical protein